jgi:hypothetical protein
MAGLAATGAACVDIVATGGAGYIEREEKRFPVAGRPQITLSTFDGAIEVRTWEQPEVLVEIEKRALDKDLIGDIEVRTEQDGSQITVEVRMKSGSSAWGLHRSARLKVSLPASSDLTAKTGDGAIDVERVSGRIDLRSGDGAIRGQELSGDVTARTGDGSIRLDRIDGRLDLDTGDGSIVAAGTFTRLRVRSGDGSVRIHVERGSTALEDWDVVDRRRAGDNRSSRKVRRRVGCAHRRRPRLGQRAHSVANDREHSSGDSGTARRRRPFLEPAIGRRLDSRGSFLTRMTSAQATYCRSA